MLLLKKAAALLFIIVLFSSSIASAQNVQDFRIQSFDADYYLERNEAKTALLRIEETIVAEFPNFDQNHGIERAIPGRYQGNTLSLEIISVTDEQNRALQYSEYASNDNKVLRIGDPSAYVRGQQTYKISYSLKNVISFQELDEFFWDVNGDQWSQTFGRVSATIHLPNELAELLSPDMRCFTGSFGVNESDCLITKSETGEGIEVNVAATRPLILGENMSFVLGFQKGTFVLGPEIAAEKRAKQLFIAYLLVSVSLPILIAIVYVIRRYRRYGKDPEGRGSITPQYIPIKNFNPLKSAAILKETVSSKAISATILELAIKRYITIYETEEKSKEYEIELIADPKALTDDVAIVIDALFSGGGVGTRVKLSSLKYKLYSKVKDLDTLLLQQLFSEGYFTANPQKVRKRYVKIGIILIILSVVISFLLVTIPFGIGLFIAGFIIIVSSYAMPSRSAKGVEAKEYLEGLKMYMQLAEKERIAFSQGLHTAERVDASPDNTLQKIKLFERLLPYAVLFGIEKDWANEFANIYQQQPDWYSSHSAFNAAVLASSITNFSSSSSNAFSAPSSSSGSGFSGGGFSGGGGGGGGGGGW